MPFPRDRFIRAGAAEYQLEALETGFDELPPAAQEAYETRLASLSDGAIAEEFLQGAPEPEPVEEEPAPPPSPSPTLSGPPVEPE